MVKQILILAEGLVAEEFIRKINNKRIPDNRYHLVLSGDLELPEKLQVQLEIHRFDPTSYSRMRRFFIQYDFTEVFILLDSLEDAGEAHKNVRRIDERIRIVLLDRWNAFAKLRHSATIVVNANEMVANHLYNFLPGVPVVAQNVGLGEGEIMEVLVPYGSSFAYRHVGSIAQVKWRIVAIYRDQKLILPTGATMIRPQDILLLVGRPQVLNNIYHRIQNRSGMFPEPFGRNLYLYLDMDRDQANALEYLRQSVYLLGKVPERELFVRVVRPGDFGVLEEIRSFVSDRITVHIDYEGKTPTEILTADAQEFDMGLIFASAATFGKKEVFDGLYESKKLVYLFGKEAVESLERAAILAAEEERMEAISSTSFYIAETLGLGLCLCIFDPEGDFDRYTKTVEHFETLAHIFHQEVQIERKQVNPVRTFREMERILHILPFGRTLAPRRRWSLSPDPERLILTKTPHPKLLVPVEM